MTQLHYFTTGSVQIPLVQGTPLQQSAATVQICPYWAHAPGLPAALEPPVLVLPPLPVPPVPPPPVVAQLPTVDPGGRLQRPPGQQSPLMVQLPPVGTHAAERQCSAPMSSGTHGLLSQQSAAEAQTSPAA